MGITAYVPDVLHCKYIGCDVYFLGGVLKVLIFHMGLLGTAQDNLKRVFREIKDAYGELGIHANRLTTLSFSKIQSASAKIACLKCSGAQAKALLPTIRHVFRKYLTPGDVQHRDILQALSDSIRFDEIMGRNRDAYRLPPADAHELHNCCWSWSQCNTRLVKHYHRRDIGAFH